jgi:hypothetical protein
MDNAISILLRMPRSRATSTAAGAIIDEEIGDIRVKMETTIVIAHFLPLVQLVVMMSTIGVRQVIENLLARVGGVRGSIPVNYYRLREGWGLFLYI